MTNDYVAMGQHICIVCGQKFDSGEILINKKMRSIPEENRATDFGLCPDDSDKMEAGFIALIETSNVEDDSRETMQSKDAIRTGRIAHIKKHAYEGVFQQPAPEGGIAFCDAKLIDRIQSMTEADPDEKINH
jgi:hypothetical protein